MEKVYINIYKYELAHKCSNELLVKLPCLP